MKLSSQDTGVFFPVCADEISFVIENITENQLLIRGT